MLVLRRTDERVAGKAVLAVLSGAGAAGSDEERAASDLGRDKVTYQLVNGDCLEVLKTLADASVDAVVTDPPYELGFMGKGWDASGIAYKVELWAECLRVLKPGGHLLAFGGTRTYHRMAVAIEDAGFEIRDSLHWIYGSGFPKSLDVSKAIDKAAGAEREVIKKRTKIQGGGNALQMRVGDRREVNADITAPATDAAKQWDGWGTALKPAFEPVVVAVKPATIGSCLSQLSVKIAAECSKSSPSAFVVAFASALRSAAPTFATQGASSEATATSQYESDKTLSWNTVASWQNTWAEVSELENTSTIGTETRPTTDLRTLLSCLSRITDANTLVRESEFSSLVHLAANLFLVSTHRLNATRTLAAIESATEGLLEGSPARDDSGPHKPVIVARKPLIGTVAANVQQHGTGALNIDGCRITTSDNLNGGTYSGGKRNPVPGDTRSSKAAGRYGEDGRLTPEDFQQPAGRWPPNILLSHAPECDKTCAEDCPVAEMDRQSGFLHASGNKKDTGAGKDANYDASSFHVSYQGRALRDYQDGGGGASRFFPVFRYQAKASRSQRGHDNKHPTVKPVALMAWLVRLVTPPRGTVLDPFMGSGTTGVAAVSKGFAFIGIEREPEYVRICEARVASAVPAQPEQKELFG